MNNMKKIVQPQIRKVYGTTNQQQQQQQQQQDNVHITAVRKINSLLSSGAVSVTGPLQPRILKQKPTATGTTEYHAAATNSVQAQRQQKCYICNEACNTTSHIYLTQASTATSKTKLPNKIGRIVGDAFMVIVCEDDIICNKCMSLFNQLDRFESDVERIRSNILNSIYKKYGISDDETAAAQQQEQQEENKPQANKILKLNSQTPQSFYQRKVLPAPAAATVNDDEHVTRKVAIAPKPPVIQRNVVANVAVDPVESQLSSLFESSNEQAQSVTAPVQSQPQVRVTHQQPVKRAPIKIYKCTTCDHKTTDIKLFQAHYDQCKQPTTTTQTQQMTQSGFRCRICKKLFATLQSLKQHNLEKHASITENITIKPADSDKSVTTITQYICSICKYETTDKRNYDEHLKKHNLKPFKCRVCSMRFEKREAAQIHAKTHQPNYFKCGSCSASFPNRDLLLKHFETHAETQKKQQTTQKLLQETINEALRSDNNDTLDTGTGQIAVAADKPINFFTCDICAVTFLQEVFYNQHMESKHKQSTSTATSMISSAASGGATGNKAGGVHNSNASIGARLNLQTALLNQSQQQQQQHQQQNSSSISDADLESIFEKIHSDKSEMEQTAGTIQSAGQGSNSGDASVSNVVITSQENSVGGITFNITIPQGDDLNINADHKIQQQASEEGSTGQQPVVSIDMPVLEAMDEQQQQEQQQNQEGKGEEGEDESGEQQQSIPVSMPSLDDEGEAQNIHGNTEAVPMDLEDVQNSVDDGQIKFILNNGELLQLNDHIITDAEGNQILVQGTDSEQIQQLLQSVGVLQAGDGMDGETALHMLNENQQMILVQQDGSGEAQLIDASMLTQDSNGQLVLQQHHDDNSQSAGEEGVQVPVSITFASQPTDMEMHDQLQQQQHDDSSQEESQQQMMEVDQQQETEQQQQQQEAEEQQTEDGDGGEPEKMEAMESSEVNNEDGNSAQDFEQSRTYIDELYSYEEGKIHEAIICLKNAVIGSNRQKGSVISQGAIPRLVKIVADESLAIDVRLDTIIVIGSLAKGSEEHVRALINADSVNELLSLVIKQNDRNLGEAALSALKSILQYNFAPIDLIRSNANTLTRIINFASPDSTIQCQACVANILVPLCGQSYNEQMLLCTAGALPFLSRLMTSPHQNLQIPALKCLASMCFTNRSVSDIVCQTVYHDRLLLEILTTLLSRANPVEIQLSSARCLTYLYRSGSLKSLDDRIVYRTLPCLARLCAQEFDEETRATAADTLAYLAEIDSDLQRLASISNHLINSLSTLLKCPTALARQGAFRCFASLGANDEDIRKRIIEMDGLMEEVVAGLGDSCPGVRLAAVRCLHSLSRSVQQLRTTFQDHTVWRPLMALLTGRSSNELLTVVTSTICNLLLEFSPAKEPMLESGAVEMLCELTHNPDPALRLNGSWALMNMAFQAEHCVKTKILKSLGTDRIFALLSDSDTRVIMKTLGLLRNLLSTSGHIDTIMSDYSTQVMQAVNFVLDSPYPPEVKEQALCIIGNIAAASQVKDYIMEDDVILKKLIEYLSHKEVKLQMGALFAIGNLVRRSENVSSERYKKLRDFGLVAKLEELFVTTSNTSQFYDDIKAIHQTIIRQIGYP